MVAIHKYCILHHIQQHIFLNCTFIAGPGQICFFDSCVLYFVSSKFCDLFWCLLPCNFLAYEIRLRLYEKKRHGIIFWSKNVKRKKVSRKKMYFLFDRDRKCVVKIHIVCNLYRCWVTFALCDQKTSKSICIAVIYVRQNKRWNIVTFSTSERNENS